MDVYGIELRDIYQAAKRIAPMIIRSPLIKAEPLSRMTGAEVYLKPEMLQPVGAFKIRGAANKLLSLSDQELKRGVIAFSTGNHGRGVAYAARQLGVRAVICLSKRVPQFRILAMEDLGAEVIRWGDSQDEAYIHALEIEQEHGLTMVEPFDDALVIAGQGTIGLEILEDLPEVGTVIVPVSGGGLMAGVALALKKADPEIATHGVSIQAAPAMYASLKAGKPVEIPEKDSLADALLGGIGLKNRYTFKMIQDLMDKMTLVSEAEIASAMVYCLKDLKMVVEGSGAVGVAALRSGKIKPGRGPVVVVLSGGNADMDWLIKEAGL